MMLPSQKTASQREALRTFLDAPQGIEVFEPCDCGGLTRHNNGGNYHTEVYYRHEAGQVFRAETFSGDYGPPLDWQPVVFGNAIDEIASLAAKGWDCRPRL
jgi:hypothetical protein